MGEREKKKLFLISLPILQSRLVVKAKTGLNRSPFVFLTFGKTRRNGTVHAILLPGRRS